MSLLDTAPDVLRVYPEVDGTDGYGTPTRVPSATATLVRGWVQPLSADESAAFGQSTTTLCRFYGRTFPGGAYALVVFDGADFDVVGRPEEHRGPGALGHVSVVLRRR